MKLTRRQFESFIKSKSHDQLLKIILEITKDNRDLEKEIYFRYEGVEEFSKEDFNELYEKLVKIRNKAHRSFAKVTNRNDLSQCLTSLIEIFKKSIKPLVKEGYYEYVLQLVAEMLYTCENTLNSNKTKRLMKFKEDLAQCLYKMLDKLSLDELAHCYFLMSDLIIHYEADNLNKIFYHVFLESTKLTEFEEKSQQWLEKHYVDDLEQNLDDNNYSKIASFNASLKERLGIDNLDMKDQFINCYDIRNYFINKFYNSQNYQDLIDYSKKIKKLKGLGPYDLKVLNEALIETFRKLGDKEHLMEELEYNISSYDQENLELLAEYLSFYDRSEQKEQAEWFMGSKTFTHDYDLFTLNGIVEELLNKKFKSIFRMDFNRFYNVLYFLMPQEIVDYSIWKFENTIADFNSIDEYDYLTELLMKAKEIDEERITSFSKEVAEKYPTRRYLQKFLVERELI